MSIADLNTPNNINGHFASLSLSNANSNQTLSIYKKYTINATATGPFTTPQATTLTINQLDNLVYVSFPDVVAATNVTTNQILFTLAAPLPSPIRDQYLPIMCFSSNANNNVPVPGFLQITASGGIIITLSYIGTAPTFFGTAGYKGFSVCYCLN
jgi:hypothetical protein